VTTLQVSLSDQDIERLAEWSAIDQCGLREPSCHPGVR